MQIGIAHLVAFFVGMTLLVGGAFAAGHEWQGNKSAETAAAVSALESESDSGEEYIDKETPAPTDAPLYKVLRVVDGDTIVIEVEGKSESVRLIGVDTPELNDSRTGVQCFAKEAAEKMKSFVTGKSIRLEKDPSQGDRDKYKRLLGYVFVENGAFVNKALIAEGYAHEYTYDGEYKYQKQLKAAQAEAKEAGAGLWAEENCPTTPPVRPAKSAPKKESQAAAAVGAAATTQPIQQPVQPAQPTTTPQPEPKPEPIEEPKPEVKKEPEPEPASSSDIVCSSNTYNCTHFKTKEEAQRVYDQCGGLSNDIHKLDKNKDGSACDSLP